MTGLKTGARIGRYLVIESVGLGAMGVVYGAYDPELDRKVALKLLKPGHGAKETARARLVREAKAMARLSHPNVVAVHDVGVFEDQVFLAMEFLSGGTVKTWLAARTRSWREILAVFVAAGRGLIAAHSAGLVHRDFKPDNVLLDKDGRPRVVDFGIAREAASGAEELGELEATGEPGLAAARSTPHLRESSGSNRPLLTLTKTGALVGTPAYMAPEQFMGERGDERSDQFAFCVAVYEGLYGERPFAGDDVLSISLNVTQEQMRPLPKDRGVPTWIRRVIVRGMRLNPSARWPSMAALVAALEDDPAVKLRRRLIAAGTIALVVVTVLVARQMVTRRRLEADRDIARNLDDGRAAAVIARSKAEAAQNLRGRAFEAFDRMDKERGESLWRETRGVLASADAEYDRAERALEAASTLDQGRREIRAELADIRRQHYLMAGNFHLAGKAQILRERVMALDSALPDTKEVDSAGTFSLRTRPIAARALLERYEQDPATGHRDAKPVGPLDAAQSTTTLPPGSYRVTFEGPGLAHVLYPFEVRGGERISADLSLPPSAAVPDGFIYVPPGEFWFGDSDEQLRSQFLGTVPIHRRKTDAYLIARDETTYAEWISFLDAIPPSQVKSNLPDVSVATRGSLRLRRDAGSWELELQPTTKRYIATVGEPVVYVGRRQRVRQDWSRFPVAGISPVEANHYFEWLRRTDRVPRARLCTELEWERAARGADDRLFPHGDELAPDEANIDITYGRVDPAYGPDEVGSHPASRSPFGVDDLAGNVFDLVTSSLEPNQYVIRGGAYFFQPINSRSTNREQVPPTYRDITTGIRVCASLSEGR